MPVNCLLPENDAKSCNKFGSELPKPDCVNLAVVKCLKYECVLVLVLKLSKPTSMRLCACQVHLV